MFYNLVKNYTLFSNFDKEIYCFPARCKIPLKAFPNKHYSPNFQNRPQAIFFVCSADGLTFVF